MRKGGGKNVLQQMETHFSQIGDSLWGQLTDLSLPTSELQSSWNELIQVRTEIARLHAVDWVTEEAAKGGAGGDGESSLEDWKSMLGHAYAKQMKVSASKDILVYTAINNGQGFEATCECTWSGTTYSGEARASKKQAEHSAAKVALQSEFPAFFQAACAQMSGGQGAVPQLAGKRKLEAVDQSTDPKQLLNTKMMIVKTEMGLSPIASGDIKVESTPLDGGKFVSEVTIGFLEGKNRHKGRPQESKKAAEKNACEVALKALASIISQYEAPWNERKKRKNAESLAKLKENQKVKNELKKANAVEFL